MTRVGTETLLSYHVIELERVAPSSTDGAVVQGAVSEIISAIGNVPVELRGGASLFFILSLFKGLRSMAEEITYRPAWDQPAVVIYSALGQEYIRPAGVVDLAARWSEEDMEKFKKHWAADAPSEIEINLDKLWQESQVKTVGKDGPDQLENFLRYLYSMNPNKQTVSLTGSAPFTATLLVVNWFLSGGTKNIHLESNRLS